jgi:hypothetical protein
MSKKSFWILTFSFVLVKLLLHFLTNTNYELHRDEMLYFSMGSHLSWGFASTPPFMSLLAFIIKNVFGYHAFFVRLFPALFNAATMVLVALTIRQIGGREFAVFTGCFGFIISTAMLRTATLFMPVVFELFFWMLFLFLVLKLIETQNPKFWIWIGVCFGLAFLNKYSILVLGFSTFIAFLMTEHRKLLLSKYLVYSALLCLLIMSPNIIWQIDHKFAVMTHMHELYRTQLAYVPKMVFLSEQLMMNFTAILIWLPGLIMVLFLKAEKKYRIFGLILLIVVFMFLILKGKPYYTLGVYPIMFAFGGYFAEKYLTGRLRILSYSILALSFVVTIFFLPLGLPVLKKAKLEKYCAFFSKHVTSAPMRNENNGYYPIPQDYMDMAGWDELAALASEAYNKLDPDQKKNCVIYANNYGQAGAIDFYGKKYNLPSPIGVNDSYVFWAPDSIKATNFIITDDEPGDIPDLFNDYREIGEINDPCFRENGLKVYLCQNPKPLLYNFLDKRIKEQKEIYGY